MAHTPLTEHTIHCPHCPSPIIISTSVPLTNAAPTHCPVHAKYSPVTVTDGWDYYAISLNFNRKCTLYALRDSQKQFAHSLTYPNTTPRHYINTNPILTGSRPANRMPNKIKNPNLSNAEWAHTIIQNMPTYPTASTPLVCTVCAQTFTITQSANNPHAPTHCPYCTNILAPLELTAFDYLAPKYNIAPIPAQVLYNMWRTMYTSYATFDLFTQSLNEKFTKGYNANKGSN